MPDVPSPIDLRDPETARTWTREADAKRPWRQQMRGAIAQRLSTAHRVLELGSGPGLLADCILSSCEIDSYTLFDFSPPMLELSRDRVGHHRAATFVLGDFKQPDWPHKLAGPFDAVVAMQSVHEIRHKRHIRGLYEQIRGALRPGGVLLVSDHAPIGESELLATEAEQHTAMRAAGFGEVTTELCIERLYLCSAKL